MPRIVPRRSPWVCLVIAWCGTAAAQPPTLTVMQPAGLQKGVPVELTLTGANLAEPIELRTTFPARWQFLPGGTATQLRLRLEAEPASMLGWHQVYLVTKQGLSNSRLFCVDELPQIQVAGTPHSATQAQPLTTPCVVCGAMEREKSHWFKLTVRAGQRLSFEMLGRRLGSPLDPQLTIFDASGQKQLAFSDDAPGQQKDPRLQYVFKEAGDVLVELRDVRYLGGADWVYRLRIGDFPLVSVPFPLAVQAGKSAVLDFIGPGVDPANKVQVDTAGLKQTDMKRYASAMPVWTRGPAIFPTSTTGLPSWPVTLLVSDHPEIVESGSNVSAATAQEIPVPGGVSGRFPEPGSKRFYRFAAHKGQRYRIQIASHALGAPTTVLLTLLDSTGKTLMASNPADDPVNLVFAAPADGSFVVQAEHLHYKGGPDEAFHLTITPVRPAFRLAVATDRLNVPTGHGIALLVTTQRQEFNGAIEITQVGSDAVLGVIPEGQTQTLCWLPAANATPIVRLSGRARSQAGAGPHDLSAEADAVNVLRQGSGNLRYPPLYLGRELVVNLTPAPPFTLAARYQHPTAVRGLPVSVVLTVTRPSGPAEELTLTTETLPSPQGQPPWVAPLRAKVPADRAELTVELRPVGNAPDGLPIVVKATNQGGKQALGVLLPPLRFGPPFELGVGEVPALRPAGQYIQPKLNPVVSVPLMWGGVAWPMPILDEAFWRSGRGQQELRVRIQRQGGYQGPLTLELQNLPAGVSADKVTVPERANEALLVVKTAADAKPIQKSDVVVLGTALAAGNQQHRSPVFTVTVTGPRP